MPTQSFHRQLPVVAIVGRPNVGKSSLFNRLTGTRKAVVHETPGLTRDRNYAVANWQGKDLLVIDTGGYEADDRSSEIQRHMREQMLMAVEEADVVIFLASVEEPNHPLDDHVLRTLRRSRKPMLLAVNKCDNQRKRLSAQMDFADFGLPVYPISALHGIGTGDLLEAAAPFLPEFEPDSDLDLGTRIAVVGRPNVGKSSLVNKILGYTRSIASPVAGTTRDPIDTTFERDGTTYTLIDTAGIRRRGRIEQGVEKLTVVAALQSLRRCEVALVVIDGSEGLREQDAHVAGMAVDAGCAVIILINKWDLVDKDHRTHDLLVKTVHEEWGFLKHAPVLSTSAVTGQRLDRLFEVIDQVAEHYRSELPTNRLNKVLQTAIARLSPPRKGKRALKVKYVTQTGTCPPTLTFFVNDPELIHFSYERYLANQIRGEFGLEGVPLRLEFRMKSDRKDDEDEDS
jgi:GTP-binding protein